MEPVHPYLDHPGPIPLAHRGGADDPSGAAAPESAPLENTALENTMLAFQNAVELGFRYLETDVHATSDGVLLAFHDSNLERMTDTSGSIEEMTFGETRQVRVGGREPIPLFEDILTTFPNVRISIDPKKNSAVAPLMSMLRRLDCLDRVCIGAFSDRRLAHIRTELGPEACLGLGPRHIAKLLGAARGLPLGQVPGQVAQVPPSKGPLTFAKPKFIARAHRAGVAVHIWTVDDPTEMNELLDLGVDGIMTDRPAVLKGVLEKRHQWYG